MSGSGRQPQFERFDRAAAQSPTAAVQMRRAGIRRRAAHRRQGACVRGRPEAVGHGAPLRSYKSIEAAVQVAATRLVNLLRLDAYERGHGSRPPADRRCGKPPTPSTIPPLIRCSSAPRPSSSTSASVGSQNRHRSSAGEAGRARACPRPPARGHSGVGTRPEVPRHACRAALCRRESMLDPHHRPQHNQVRAIETPIRRTQC